MSQHLAVLRAAGLVSTRRDGSTVYYRLADPRVLEAYASCSRSPADRSLRLPAFAGERITPDGDIRVATDATFEPMVIKNDKPVLVDFWAAWCGPCKMVAPEMEKIARKYDGAIEVVKVDVDANPGLSRAFNIMCIPTIAFFQPGKQPMGVVGFRPMDQLETQFDLASFPKVEAAVAAASAEPEAASASDAA